MEFYRELILRVASFSHHLQNIEAEIEQILDDHDFYDEDREQF
jgi:hypothetical protein